MVTLTRQWRRLVEEQLTASGLTDATWTPLLHLRAWGDGVTQKELAERVGLRPEAVIDGLCRAVLRVGLIGFMPGFPYLIGLPQALHLPRRATPRTRVPAGSVALAAGLCGVYPWDSPGGWWLVGHLPLPLFEADHPQAPAWLAAGDRLSWQPVDAPTPAALAADWAAGRLRREDFLMPEDA